ncbi:MAG: LD-carboxypeptidase [Candidatus Manganitrophus sp.]|nr:LD-carboxypeptidase [Candidatus Manganitrophus sp.]
MVAPAGRVEPTDLHRGVLRLEQLGFKVIVGQHVEKRHRYLAGKDPDRAADLQLMFENRDVRAVLCARGGSRNGPASSFPRSELLASEPKIFLGCSDVTTLLLYFSRILDWVTFHGPMVATQFGKGPNQAMDENFMKLLGGQAVEMSFPGVRTLRDGRAEGILTGGCLTLICTTIGTPYEIETEG